ncbi:MAG: hypothetical protein IKE23_11870 [Exiguobacterium sp.]|nr:hypothetical protein [Exiguobacterium sp.]
MQVYEVAVVDRAVMPNGGDTTLVRTSIGVDELHVLFDSSEWLDFGVRVTFTNGETSVVQSITLNAIVSDGYAAEASCDIPWEVIQDVGGIEITFNGTNSDSDYIITQASGTPLTVVQEGINNGTAPTPEPTISEWEQAYSQAMSVVNEATTVIADIQERIDDIVAEAEDEIREEIQINPATDETLGTIMVGEGLSITESGVLSADDTNGISAEQAAAIEHVKKLTDYAFYQEVDEGSGDINVAYVKPYSLPIATRQALGAVKLDGTTTDIGSGGTISVVASGLADGETTAAEDNKLSVIASGLADGETIVAEDNKLSVAEDYIQSKLATLDGALKYKDTLESVDDLDDIESPSIGDLYIVGDVSYFWDGEDWVVVSPDLTPYELSANLSPITPAEVHQITQQSGSWAGEYYVTQASLDASLNTHTQFIESYLDEQLEAILNGSY